MPETFVMIKNGVIAFFYVDDIVFANRKKHENELWEGL
jgi:hypothetical protein